jgi:hypothetical protein
MGHRASRRAYPEGQFAPMKWVNIKDLWYELSRSEAFGYSHSPEEARSCHFRTVIIGQR